VLGDGETDGRALAVGLGVTVGDGVGSKLPVGDGLGESVPSLPESTPLA
jgi:hypothetical protein